MPVVEVLHWVAGLIVLAEAVNKLDEVDIFGADMSTIDRYFDLFKALAWLLIAFGAAGAVVQPTIPYFNGNHPMLAWLLYDPSTFANTAVLVGTMIHVIRARIKSGFCQDQQSIAQGADHGS